MKCLKHKESGAIVRVTNQVAMPLLKGGDYAPSSKGAYKRQQKLVARGRISIETVKPRRSLPKGNRLLMEVVYNFFKNVNSKAMPLKIFWLIKKLPSLQVVFLLNGIFKSREKGVDLIDPLRKFFKPRFNYCFIIKLTFQDKIQLVLPFVYADPARNIG
ncbi:hypothetical protein LCGC14_2522200 [marine sediment metagenome]|uniref:Uncharacterized protein n=1 Tax=marine sediment metagenome TaxID=412755 RepID=A0A0F9AW32_9ZZZZ